MRVMQSRMQHASQSYLGAIRSGCLTRIPQCLDTDFLNVPKGLSCLGESVGFDACVLQTPVPEQLPQPATTSSAMPHHKPPASCLWRSSAERLIHGSCLVDAPALPGLPPAFVWDSQSTACLRMNTRHVHLCWYCGNRFPPLLQLA